MSTEEEPDSADLSWEEVLADSRKDVRSGRYLLASVATISLFAVVFALREGVFDELHVYLQLVALGSVVTLLVLATGASFWPAPMFRIARWFAYALAALSAVLAVSAVVKGLGPKAILKAAFKFGGYVWGASLLGEAESGAVILAAQPEAEHYFDEIVDELTDAE